MVHANPERHLRSPVIEVSVGQDQMTFRIHKSLLIEKSALFRDHLKRRANSNLKTMTILPFVKDGRHLEPFVFWMYNDHGDVLDTGEKPAYHIGQLWVVAEEIESTEYRNFLADKLQRLPAGTEWYVKSYDELYGVGRRNSVMATFMIECMAYNVATQGWQQLVGDDDTSTQAREWFGDRRQLFHRLLLAVDVMKEDLRGDKLKNPRDRYDCMLHLHETEDARENCPRHGKQEVESSTGSGTAEDIKGEDRAQKRARLEEPDNKLGAPW